MKGVERRREGVGDGTTTGRRRSGEGSRVDTAPYEGTTEGLPYLYEGRP